MVWISLCQTEIVTIETASYDEVTATTVFFDMFGHIGFLLIWRWEVHICLKFVKTIIHQEDSPSELLLLTKKCGIFTGKYAWYKYKSIAKKMWIKKRMLRTRMNSVNVEVTDDVAKLKA